jgi:very-short-patch-repair endonuclease
MVISKMSSGIGWGEIYNDPTLISYAPVEVEDTIKEGAWGDERYRTCLEKRMYGYLLSFGLRENSCEGFCEQYPIYEYFVDFYFDTTGVIFETDGAQWHNHKHQRKRDHIRDAKIKKGGFKIKRFPEYFDRDDVERALIDYKIIPIAKDK